MNEVSLILTSTLLFRLDGLFSEYSTLYAVTPLDILVGCFHCKATVVVVEVYSSSCTPSLATCHITHKLYHVSEYQVYNM